MGFRDEYSYHKNRLRDDFVDGWHDRFGGSSRLGETVERVAEKAGGAAGRVTGAVSGAVHPLKKPGKYALLAIGIAAGVGALGAMAATSRGNRARASRNEIANASMPAADEGLPPVLNTADMAPPAAETGPAPGYADNQWQSYVQAGRGSQAPAMASAAAPKMNVVPQESVQDLGAPRVR